MRPILYLHKHNRLFITFLFLGLTVFFTVIILPLEATILSELTGDQTVPDLRLYYLPSDLQIIARGFTEAGRQQYIISRLRFDIVWPLIYGGTLFSLTSQFIKIIKSGHAFLGVAVLAIIFDFIENTAVSIYFYIYPTHNALIAMIAGLATFLKWISIITAFSLMVTLGAIVFRSWFDQRKTYTK